MAQALLSSGPTPGYEQEQIPRRGRPSLEGTCQTSVLERQQLGGHLPAQGG